MPCRPVYGAYSLSHHNNYRAHPEQASFKAMYHIEVGEHYVNLVSLGGPIAFTLFTAGRSSCTSLRDKLCTAVSNTHSYTLQALCWEK